MKRRKKVAILSMVSGVSFASGDRSEGDWSLSEIRSVREIPKIEDTEKDGA
jgi:hypothetical protein